jgi:hypothetical protein
VPHTGARRLLSSAGARAAAGRIERTEPLLFSTDDMADVGIDEGTPVTED